MNNNIERARRYVNRNNPCGITACCCISGITGPTGPTGPTGLTGPTGP